MPEEESGIDELMRLSRQFTRQQEEHDQREKQRQAQGKKVKGVLQSLKELNLNMAVTQLKTCARPEIVRQVNALKSQENTDALRKMISDIADDLENSLRALPAPKTETAPLVNAMRTLNILMDLYFSLH
jgi:glutamyl-tRNA reductase